jgi:hypothetical protein
MLLACVLIAALGVHLASTTKCVRGRAQAHQHYPIVASYTDFNPKQPPLFWRLLGARPTSVVSLRSSATSSDRASLQRLFPEARIVVSNCD